MKEREDMKDLTQVLNYYVTLQANGHMYHFDDDPTEIAGLPLGIEQKVAVSRTICDREGQDPFALALAAEHFLVLWGDADDDEQSCKNAADALLNHMPDLVDEIRLLAIHRISYALRNSRAARVYIEDIFRIKPLEPLNEELLDKYYNADDLERFLEGWYKMWDAGENNHSMLMFGAITKWSGAETTPEIAEFLLGK